MTRLEANSPHPKDVQTVTRGKHVLILGGGLSGLSAGCRLAKNGWRVTVVESGDEVGGLASSGTHVTQWGEFDYDTGPHRFHTGEKHLKDEVLMLLGDNKVEANRLSRIFLYGRFFNYPLVGSNVVKSLPKLVLLKCFLDYLWVKIRNIFHRPPDDNFENWVVNRFGRKLYTIFFGVYTEKTWGIPCTQISADWAAQRISLLSLWDTVKKTLFKPKDEEGPRTLVSKFFYPRRGGIGVLSKRYAEEIEKLGGSVLTKTKAVEVRVAGRTRDRRPRRGPGRPALHRGGHDASRPSPSRSSRRSCRPRRRPRCSPPPRRCVTAAWRSCTSSSTAPSSRTITGSTCPRTRSPSTGSRSTRTSRPTRRPPDKTLICAEITCDYGDEIWSESDENLRKICVDDLVKIGLIRREEVLETFSRRARYAYPLYDLQYRGNKDARAPLARDDPGPGHHGPAGALQVQQHGSQHRDGARGGREPHGTRRVAQEDRGGPDLFRLRKPAAPSGS